MTAQTVKSYFDEDFGRQVEQCPNCEARWEEGSRLRKESGHCPACKVELTGFKEVSEEQEKEEMKKREKWKKEYEERQTQQWAMETPTDRSVRMQKFLGCTRETPTIELFRRMLTLTVEQLQSLGYSETEDQLEATKKQVQVYIKDLEEKQDETRNIS